VNEAVANAIGSMATQFGLLAERAETSALAHVQAQLTALQVNEDDFMILFSSLDRAVKTFSF